jgi:hypothetical protein
VPLGPKIGIRDMVLFDADRLLLLTGPSGEDNGSYWIKVFNVCSHSLQDVAELSSAVGSPEAILLAQALDGADQGASRAKLLILDDGVKNGNPRLVEVTVPAAEAMTC